MTIQEIPQASLFPEIKNIEAKRNVPTVPEFIQSLPAFVQRRVCLDCEGDWTRVTMDATGAIVISNRTQFREINLDTQQVPSQRAKAKKPPRRSSRKKTAPVAQTDGVDFRAMGPRVWEHVGLGEATLKLKELCAEGIPEVFELDFSDSVLRYDGIDFQEIADATRYPRDVKISDSVMEKGYPILEFTRGRTVIVGFRDPERPMVMAITGTASQGGSRHGSFRASVRIERRPATAAQLVDRLTRLGASISTDKGLTKVNYQGRYLGPINSPNDDREFVVDKDWRRIHAAMVKVDQGRLR